MITFGDIKDFIAPYVKGSGVCPDDPRCKDAVNEAIERLMVKPNLVEHLLIRNVRFLAYGNYITLPRNIDRILRMRIGNYDATQTDPVSGTYPAIAANMWYEFMDSGPGLRREDSIAGQDMYDLGETSTRYDIPVSSTVAGYRLMALSDNDEDAGATILIRGLDETGREVFFDGSIGEPLPIQPKEFATYTSTLFHRIDNVIKPRTKGYIYLMTYDPDTEEVFHLAEYHPDETICRYRRYGFRGHNYDEDDVPFCYYIAALVKLRFVPVTQDSDMLQIANRSALKTMVQAIHLYDSGDPEKAAAYEGIAEKILADETQNRIEDPAFPLDVQANAWLTADSPAML